MLGQGFYESESFIPNTNSLSATFNARTSKTKSRSTIKALPLFFLAKSVGEKAMGKNPLC